MPVCWDVLRGFGALPDRGTGNVIFDGTLHNCMRVPDVSAAFFLSLCWLGRARDVFLLEDEPAGERSRAGPGLWFWFCDLVRVPLMKPRRISAPHMDGCAASGPRCISGRAGCRASIGYGLFSGAEVHTLRYNKYGIHGEPRLCHSRRANQLGGYQ